MVGTAASGRFFDYYYIQLLPPLCLLAAPWFGQPAASSPWRRRLRWTHVAVGCCAALFLVVNLAEDPGPLGQTPVDRYIRAHSDPDDYLFVWGQDTKFYLGADLAPASRYIAFFPLTGYIFGSPWNHDPTHENTDGRILPGAWTNLARDFAAHPPRYILDLEGVRYPPKYPIRHFPVLYDQLTRDYRLVFTGPEGLLYERRGTRAQPVERTGGAERRR